MDYLQEQNGRKDRSFAEFIRWLIEWEMPPKEFFEKILMEILRKNPG